MRIYLCPNCRTKERLEASRGAAEVLNERLHAEILMSARDSTQLYGDHSHAGRPSQASLVVSVGGDGSVLHAAQTAVRSGLPLVGVNSGRLGYLCAFQLSDLETITCETLQSLEKQQRTMLMFTLNGKRHIALNDVVLARSRLAGTLSARVTRGREVLLDFRGDGLIISTPTGSTAYNRSAGGPVLAQDTHCLAVTPVCAHTPGTAPIVVPDDEACVVTVTDAGDDRADVLADGVSLGSPDGPLTVSRYEKCLTLLRQRE